MEILCITHKYPPSVGGMQKQSFELIRGLSRRMTVHTLIHSGDSGKALFFLTLKKKVLRMLREHPGISLIHLNDGLMAFFALPLRSVTDLPIVATLHGLDVVMPAGWYQRRVLPRFAAYDGIIAVSSATAQACRQRGFDPAKITVVPNGVDTALGDIPAEPNYRAVIGRRLGLDLTHRKIVLMLGRPVPRKGFIWFLREVLPKLGPDVLCLHIGPSAAAMGLKNFLLRLLPFNWGRQLALIFGMPTDEPALRHELALPELAGRAFRLGGLPFKDLVQTLKCGDLYVMPNVRLAGDMEGFGLAALEAAICGLPVVASEVDGIVDAVQEGKNGFLLPPEEPELWARRITGLLADPAGLRAAGEAAREFTKEHYSWDRMVDGYEAVFKRFA